MRRIKGYDFHRGPTRRENASILIKHNEQNVSDTILLSEFRKKEKQSFVFPTKEKKMSFAVKVREGH